MSRSGFACLAAISASAIGLRRRWPDEMWIERWAPWMAATHCDNTFRLDLSVRKVVEPSLTSKLSEVKRTSRPGVSGMFDRSAVDTSKAREGTATPFVG